VPANHKRKPFVIVLNRKSGTEIDKPPPGLAVPTGACGPRARSRLRDLETRDGIELASGDPSKLTIGHVSWVAIALSSSKRFGRLQGCRAIDQVGPEKSARQVIPIEIG
jgi:hypothetical protein